jgi:hypothetical protein
MSVNNLTVVGPPAMPSWLLILRIIIIVLSLGVLVAAAYNLSLFHGYANYLEGYSGPAGFLIFDVSLPGVENTGTRLGANTCFALQ